MKGLRHKKQGELIDILTSEECKLTNANDIEFIKKQEQEIKALFTEAEEEVKEVAEMKKDAANITTSDRLRFLEAMLSEEVRGLYLKSQDSLTRAELDSRNSVMQVVDFYDKVVEVFNSHEFKPQTQSLPDLHEDFSKSMDLPLKIIL